MPLNGTSADLWACATIMFLPCREPQLDFLRKDTTINLLALALLSPDCRFNMKNGAPCGYDLSACPPNNNTCESTRTVPFDETRAGPSVVRVQFQGTLARLCQMSDDLMKIKNNIFVLVFRNATGSTYAVMARFP